MNQTMSKFTSPINEDTGTHHRFIGNAESTMVFHPPERTSRGRIEWTVRFVDGEHTDCEMCQEIFLQFDGKRLDHFCGVYEMPDEAIALLEANGYDASYARQ